MEIQQEISNKKLKEKIGKEIEVIIENFSFDKKYLIGRTMQDVPKEDGIIYIKNEKNQNIINKFVMVKIVDSEEYDLIGELI